MSTLANFHRVPVSENSMIMFMFIFKYRIYSRIGRVILDNFFSHLQNSYVYYKLESKATTNFYVTSKRLGRIEKKMWLSTT